MPYSFSQMSTPPPYGPPPGGPPPGYGAPPPYGAPPQKSSGAKIVLIVLACVLGGGVVVIGILAAILFPVFSKVRENARAASCRFNVKQIELGMIQYTQDHNDTFPKSAAAYKDAVFPYIQSEGVFHCPSDQGGPVDYSLNTKLQGISMDKIAHPERVIAVYEGKNQTPDFRHDGQAVIGYADGHVQEVPEAQAASLKWTP